MSDLKDQLRADLTTAMKARDHVRAGALRMVLAAITNAEVAGKAARELSDAEVLDVLGSQAKKRREAAVAFADAGREEKAAQERAELDVITAYLPEQLDEAAITALVTETVSRLGVAGQGMKAMGKVMGALQGQVKGRADGAVVAAEVRRQLG